MQQKDGSFFGVNGQGNYSEHLVHHNIRPVVVNTPYHQTREDIIQNRNEFLPSWHTTNDTFRENDAGLRLFNGGGELLRNYKNQETHPISNNSSTVCGISRQSVVPRSFSHPFDAWGGNEEYISGLEGINSSNVDQNRYPFKNYEVLNQNITSSGGFDVESKESLPKFGNTQLFSYINNDNYNSKVVNIQSPAPVFLDSQSGNDPRQNSTIPLNEVPYSSVPRNFIYHSNDQNYKSLNTQANNFVMKPEISTSNDANLLKCSDAFATATDQVVKDQNESHSKLDECDKIKDEKSFPEAVEKLWDGSLQLNSCITASMIALFKSGERIPDVNWSELIEVKGKVRLDAFEKYIQDLPRSRNRGLMVISLTWKNGSSQAGLKGVKEVAERYEQGEKVGLAQLSTGIDLYICPTSDSITTLLLKYGFLKGTMSSSEDRPGSLIGCVVWRKTLFPPPKPAEKTIPQPLPVAEADSPTVLLDQHPLLESGPLQEGDEGPATGASDPSSSTNPCGPHHPTAIETEPPTPWSPNRHPPISEPESELEKRAELKRAGDSDEDDDLPEYDFSYANTDTDGGRVRPGEYDFQKVKYEPPAPTATAATLTSCVSISPLQMPAVTGPVFSRKRWLFDDDDMPEWQPPELDPPENRRFPPEPPRSGYQLPPLMAPDCEKRRNLGFYGGNGKR